MILSDLSEVVWRFYQDGKAKADKQNLRRQDITQMCKTSISANFRQQYIWGGRPPAGRRTLSPGDEGDWYFWSPVLKVKRFGLTEADELGMRRADMGEFDLYRLPKNAHFSNIYMVNTACAGLKTNTIDLVQNGQEKFFAGKEKFRSYIFGAVVGRGLNTYNVPPCISKLDIETTYDGDDIDISLDVAMDVSVEVLKIALEVFQANGDDKIRLTEELKKKEEIK